MKQSIKWIVALVAAASAVLVIAGPSYGCGCQRLAPVRERIIQRNVCSMQQPVVLERTCNWNGPYDVAWSQPTHPGLVVTSVDNNLAWTGRTLNGPSQFVSSSEFIEPVGERITTLTTTKTFHHKYAKRLIIKKVTYSNSMLLPVGERFIQKPLCEPVGERITTVKYLKMRPVLEPVGEKTIIRTTRVYSNSWNSCDF